MGAYIIRRLLLIIPTLFLIMLINFIVVQLAPGGPVEQAIANLTGQGADITTRVTQGGAGETGQIHLPGLQMGHGSPMPKYCSISGCFCDTDEGKLRGVARCDFEAR